MQMRFARFPGENALMAQVTQTMREAITIDAPRHKDIEADPLVFIPKKMRID